MTKLIYMMIKEFKDELKKNLNENENLNKNITKRKSNLLDDEISDTL